MTKYFKKFNTHEEYEAYITSESKILPNVSVCVINKHVHYNPRTKSVTGVTLNKSSLSLNVGASETLVATVLPSGATDKRVTWTSSNSGVATVDSSGKVTAIGGGNAIITVRTVDGSFTAQCATSVAVSVTGVTLNKSSLSLNVGASETLVATVLPPSATDKRVTWNSSDSSVATVDDNGLVTAIGSGNATITVRTVDGNFTAQCATSVAVGVTGVTLNKSSLSLDQGASETLVATVLPPSATDKRVTWTSSNSSVATVDDTGKVSGVSSGNATITVTTVDGGFTAQCDASVQNVSYLITKYNVTSTTVPTIIGNSRSTSNFTEIEIDGVKLPNVVSAYTFTSLGEHDVRYKVVGTQIGDRALSGCSSLTSVEMTDNVTSIGEDAFYGCSGLTSITIPNSVTSIGVQAFRGCSNLTSITIPNSVTSIAYQAFYVCSSLTSVTIPNSVTSIGNEAFLACSSLTSVTIGNSVTSIGGWAFRGCSSLSSVTIPSSVTSIEYSAFEGCSGLTSVTIPNSVTSIGNGVFAYCSSLTSMSVENGNAKYDSRNNCNAIIETASNTLIACCQNTVISNNVTSIGNEAFQGCRGLTTVTIPNSVTSIGSWAFRDCTSLTSVTIPNSVTSIGSSAFQGCRGLTTVTIPNSVTSIGNEAFWGCRGLTSITIGNSVTSIGNSVFYYCSSLTSIISNATIAPDISSDTFRSVNTSGTLTVPSGSSGYDTWMQNANYYLGLYGWTKVEQ